jgi:hypothetical protein
VSLADDARVIWVSSAGELLACDEKRDLVVRGWMKAGLDPEASEAG